MHRTIAIVRSAFSLFVLAGVLGAGLCLPIRGETPLVPAPKLPPPANAVICSDGTIIYPDGCVLYPNGVYVYPNGTTGILGAA